MFVGVIILDYVLLLTNNQPHLKRQSYITTSMGKSISNFYTMGRFVFSKSIVSFWKCHYKILNMAVDFLPFIWLMYQCVWVSQGFYNLQCNSVVVFVHVSFYIVSFSTITKHHNVRKTSLCICVWQGIVICNRIIDFQ